MRTFIIINFRKDDRSTIHKYLNYLRHGLVGQLLASGLKNPNEEVAIIEDYDLFSGGGKYAARISVKLIKAANGLELKVLSNMV